jgi:hypothetical protein
MLELQWESQGDILRGLPTRRARIPRDFMELYYLLGMCNPDDGLSGLLNLIDFSQGSPAELLSLLYGHAASESLSGVGDALPEALCKALLSSEFRARAMQSVLAAFPEKGRDIFVHIPKCAGTDLILSLASRNLPVSKMLESRDWLPDREFIACLAALARLAPFHERFFVYGHIELTEYVQVCGVRRSDSIFTIIRDPIDLMLSQANYAIGRLRQDPAGTQPDTAETLQLLGVARLPESASTSELKNLTVRALLDSRIARPNLMCLHLSNAEHATASSAIENLVGYDIEVTTTRHYERWLSQRWGVTESRHHNHSDPILHRNEVMRLYAHQLHPMIAEDQKLHDLICRALDETGDPAVTGKQIGSMDHARLTDIHSGRSVAGCNGDLEKFVVVEEPDKVTAYLQPISIAVEGASKCETMLDVDFGAKGSGTQYQVSGWSAAESAFTWTNASESRLLLPAVPVDGQYVLRLVGSPFVCKPHLPYQRVGIALNNEFLGDFTIREIAVVEVEIPRHIAIAGGPVEVTLRLHDAAVPAEYGRQDDRLLAFALHRLAILRVEDYGTAAVGVGENAALSGSRPA